MTAAILGGIVGTSRRALVLGCVVVALASLAYAAACHFLLGRIAILALFAMGVGIGLIQIQGLPCLLQVVTGEEDSADEEQLALCTSAMEFSSNLGDATGPVVLGVI